MTFVLTRHLPPTYVYSKSDRGIEDRERREYREGRCWPSVHPPIQPPMRDRRDWEDSAVTSPTNTNSTDDRQMGESPAGEQGKRGKFSLVPLPQRHPVRAVSYYVVSTSKKKKKKKSDSTPLGSNKHPNFLEPLSSSYRPILSVRSCPIQLIGYPVLFDPSAIRSLIVNSCHRRPTSRCHPELHRVRVAKQHPSPLRSSRIMGYP